MIDLSPEICRRMREARRAAGLSQSRLAAEVGCRQNAISMVEQGDGTKLNDEAIKKICEKFNIDLTPKAEPKAAPAPVVRVPVARTGFCPNPLCPSHASYEVDGRRLLRPDRAVQDPVGATYCAVCGEVLERACPNCGAPLHDGAICSHCGQPYVTVV